MSSKIEWRPTTLIPFLQLLSAINKQLDTFSMNCWIWRIIACNVKGRKTSFVSHIHLLTSLHKDLKAPGVTSVRSKKKWCGTILVPDLQLLSAINKQLDTFSMNVSNWIWRIIASNRNVKGSQRIHSLGLQIQRLISFSSRTSTLNKQSKAFKHINCIIINNAKSQQILKCRKPLLVVHVQLLSSGNKCSSAFDITLIDC